MLGVRGPSQGSGFAHGSAGGPAACGAPGARLGPGARGDWSEAARSCDPPDRRRSAARRVAENVAQRLGLRCISASAGNPTPLSGPELVALIKQAVHDPVLVMVDDKGDPGTGPGEEALAVHLPAPGHPACWGPWRWPPTHGRGASRWTCPSTGRGGSATARWTKTASLAGGGASKAIRWTCSTGCPCRLSWGWATPARREGRSTWRRDARSPPGRSGDPGALLSPGRRSRPGLILPRPGALPGSRSGAPVRVDSRPHGMLLWGQFRDGHWTGYVPRKELWTMHFYGTASRNGQGHLTIGGVDVVDLAREFGTPLYVMDEELIRQNCRAVRRGVPGPLSGFRCGIRLARRSCARPWPRLVAQEGLSLDVVSGGEIATPCRRGSRWTAPTSTATTRRPRRSGSPWRPGSAASWWTPSHELELLSRLAGERGTTARALLRVTPGVEAHTHEYIRPDSWIRSSGSPSRAAQALDAVRRPCRRTRRGAVGLPLPHRVADLRPDRLPGRLPTGCWPSPRRSGRRPGSRRRS